MRLPQGRQSAPPGRHAMSERTSTCPSVEGTRRARPVKLPVDRFGLHRDQVFDAPVILQSLRDISDCHGCRWRPPARAQRARDQVLLHELPYVGEVCARGTIFASRNSRLSGSTPAGCVRSAY